MSAAGERRRAELVGTLAALRGRIVDACRQADRDPRGVTLIAVTKTYPAADVVTLAALGVLDVGENRDQEAAAKVGEVAQLLHNDAQQPRWHFIGQLQSRKCRSVASYAHAVHSLDRSELVERLSAAVERTERPPVEAFIQVSLDDDPARGGALPGAVAALADAVAARPQLRLRGVMAVAPLHADPAAAFARLREVSAALRAQHPEADAISAGMSADLEPAIAHGSTHVRVGSALLGRRPPVFS